MAKQQKQYYFIQYQYKGRTYYKNQDGQRISAAKVKSGKRKVYLLHKSGILKDKLVERKQKKSITFKSEPPKQVRIFSVANVYLVPNVAFALTNNMAIYVVASGESYELVTNEARNKLVLFFYLIGDLFYKIFRKEVEEISLARFFIGEGRSLKDNFYIWNLDYLTIDNAEAYEDDESIGSKMDRFNKEVFSLFYSMFKK